VNNVDIELLRRLSFLEGASSGLLAKFLDAASERRFQPGQVIFEEGSSGRELYLVIEGRVEVAKGPGQDEVVLAELGAGEFFGEMGLIEDMPRSATVRTLEPTRALEFSQEGLRSVLLEEPLLLYRAMRVLMSRLRSIDVKMIDDLRQKNQALEQAYRQLQEAQAALVEKERLERELELAREIQRSSLPRRFPHIPGFQCTARSQPAHEVGGDFYDVIVLPKGRVGLVMADVSGKGIAAALYMALTRSLVHAEAKRSSSPRRVLLNVHRLLTEISEADMFVSVFYGILDPATGCLSFARAGHDQPLFYQASSGECDFLQAAGMVLGLVGTVKLEEAQKQMQRGDALVLYTDGITEANSTSNEFFGLERLRDTVCAAGQLGAEGMSDAIFERTEHFQAGAAQHDDMAVLVVKAE
jgi:serine phosphatase RsbU (regulator of sigma subunit)